MKHNVYTMQRYIVQSLTVTVQNLLRKNTMCLQCLRFVNSDMAKVAKITILIQRPAYMTQPLL